MIGNTIYGDWIGISTRVDEYEQHGAYPVKKISSKALYKLENKALHNTINEKLSAIDLEYLDHTAYFECFVWEIAATKEVLIHNILVNTHAMVATKLESGFFGENSDIEQRDIPYGFEDIKLFSNMVRSNLKNLQVYRFNDGLVDIYIAGKEKNGNWIIIHNQLHQT